MERKIILASHGHFASGILDSLELIVGANHSILALDCYVTETFDLAKSVKQLIAEYQGQELIIMTDLFGGSVNNEFLQYIDQPNIYLIAGLNLPLLIEIVTKFESADSVVELIHSVLDDSKTTIKLAKPQGVKLVIKSIADSIVALQSGVTDKYKLFIVVESIKDAQQLAEACPQIKQINLGGIKAKEGTRSLGKAVNVLPEEEERLKQLLAKNIEVEIRQVPADKKVNVKEVL